MSRKPMVTRAIITTTATILCLNKETGETPTRVVNLPRSYKNEQEILEAARPIVEEEENLRAVFVTGTVQNVQRYGMSESDFIKYAKPIIKKSDEEPADETPEETNN